MGTHRKDRTGLETDAPPLVSHVLIRASAGTGKTYQLSSRYLRLLFGGTEIDEILATTFTRKAAGEILTRIVHWLAQGASSAESRAALAQAVGRPTLTEAECLVQLRQLVRQLHRIRVSTLDSFFINLAAGFEFELGLPPNWTVCDPLDEPLDQARALSRVLQDRAADAAEWMYLLAKGEAKRGVHRALLNTVSKSHAVFSETPAEAWRKLHVPAGLSDENLDEAIGALAALAMPENKSVAGEHAKSVSYAQARDWDSFIKTGIARKLLCGEESYCRWIISPEVKSAYQRVLQQAAHACLGLVEKQTAATYQLLERYDKQFRHLQHERASIRFGDIPAALVKLMDADDDQRLAYRMGGRINHLLLDEFQDTSLQQWKSLEAISRRIVVGTPPETSFFCVGDTKQAIYGWRGGMVEIFDHIEAALAGVQRESLVASFRSSGPVIETVNRIFNGLTQHNNLADWEPGVVKWQRAFESHSTNRDDLPGYACLLTSPESTDDESEKELLVDRAVELVQELWERDPNRTIALLTRSNAQIGALIYRLRKLGIPASEEGGNSLTDSAAVQLVLSVLQLADHPNDSAAQFHLANSPLAATVRWSPASVGDRVAAAGFAHRIRRQLQTEGYGACIRSWAQALRPSCNRREWDRLQQLVELAFRFDENASLRPSEFILAVEGQRVSDVRSANVRVMTIHQSKGLEFDAVVIHELAGRNSGPDRDKLSVARDPQTLDATHVLRYASKEVQSLMPITLQRVYEDDNSREIGEKLCVLYVALTRAKHALYMIVPPRTLSGKKKSISHLKSYAGLLHASLVGEEPMEPAAVAYECGDPDWMVTLARKDGEASKKSSLPQDGDASSVLPIRFADRAGLRVHGLEAVTPSSLEGDGRLTLGDPLDDARSRALGFGILVHAWFEHVVWLDGAEPSDPVLRRVAHQLGAFSEQQLAAAIRRFRDMLELPATRGLLTRAEYTRADSLPWDARLTKALPNDVAWEVRREVPIASRTDKQLVAGSIDRLVVAWASGKVLAADVIDFKTDTIASDQQLQQRTKDYRPQLRVYGESVARMLRLSPDRVATRLLFVEPGRIVPVGDRVAPPKGFLF